MPIITSPPNLLEGWPQHGLDGRTKPSWCVYGIAFTATAGLFVLGCVFLLGFKVFVKPEQPLITIDSARLDVLNYDPQQGLLRDVQFSINAAVHNYNTRTALSFSQVSFDLRFNDSFVLMRLVAGPFEVPKNGVKALNYTVARSTNKVPLDGAMEDAINNGVIPFTIVGETRTHWKEGVVVLLKTWTRVYCDLEFYWPGGTKQDINCRSRQALVRR